VSLFLLLLLAGGIPGCGDKAHDLSGFDVPEHVSEPELCGEHNHRFLFCVLRLIGVHLFWFLVVRCVGFRWLSPPFGQPGARG
jgi:hypothetical protein